MPQHATQAGSKLGGFLEGLTGGFYEGTNLRRQRTFDAEDREDRRRRMVGEDLDRQRIMDLDELGAAALERQTRFEDEDRAAKRAALERSIELEDLGLYLEHGITRTGDPPAQPGAPQPSGAPLGDLGMATGGAPPEVLQNFRSGVGAGLAQDPDPLAAFGFERVGPTPQDLVTGLLAAEDPFEYMAKNPRAMAAAEDMGILDQLVRHEQDMDEERFGFEQDLSNSYRTESRTYQYVARAFALSRGATESPAGDQTLIFTFNNMLDPGVTVRSDDFIRVSTMGGLEAKAQYFWNQIGDNGRMPSRVREDLETEMAELAVSNARMLSVIDRFFTKRAENAGIDPSLVILNMFEDQDLSYHPGGVSIDDAVAEFSDSMTTPEKVAALVSQGFEDAEITGALQR